MVESKLKRRSPLKQQPLRNPGESLEEQLQETFTFDVLFWVTAGLFVVAAAVMEWVRWYRHTPPTPWAYTLVAVTVVAIGGFTVPRGWKRIRNLRLGLLGEMVVGQILETLRAHGYTVLHDIPERAYNIDHVLIGPAGVFVIETKTRSKPIGHDAKVEYDGQRLLVDGLAPDRDPIKQVKASCDRVREIIQAATELRPFVRPVVLYPGWYVVSTPRDQDVWVLNPLNLPSFVVHERMRLKDEEIRLLTAIFESHLRVALTPE